MRIKKTIFILVISLLLQNCLKAKEQSSNRVAPDFSLKDLTGKKVILKDFKNKSVIIWFTNLCGGCQANIPILKELCKKYKKSVEFLAISQFGKDTDTVKKVIKELKITFPFLIDPDGKVCKLYSGEYIPNTCPLNNIYFIGKNGTLRFVSHFPGLSKEELEEKIKNLIFGRR